MKKELFIVSLFIFIINSILVVTNCYQPIDELINLGVSLIRNSNVTEVIKVLTSFGDTNVIIMLNALLIIFIFFKKKYKLLVIPIASTLSGIINTGFKYLFSRPRPEGIALIAQGGFSYPSGHSAISVLFYGTIIYLLMKSDIKYKKVYITLLTIMAVIIPLTRIYLGVHYLSDVIGGVSLGFSILSIILVIYDKVTTTKEK
jgi:undecaprenyl-diphosphatase